MVNQGIDDLMPDIKFLRFPDKAFLSEKLAKRECKSAP